MPPDAKQVKSRKFASYSTIFFTLEVVCITITNMVIDFRTKQLERDLNSQARTVKKYGPDRARPIMRRMTVLRAANTLADVPHQPPERRHQLFGNRDEQFAVVIKDQWRIIFIPKHNPLPRTDDEGIDLSQVTTIEIIEIGDYHE